MVALLRKTLAVNLIPLWLCFPYALLACWTQQSIGHALSFEQINSKRWQHNDHQQSSGPTVPCRLNRLFCLFWSDLGLF